MSLAGAEARLGRFHWSLMIATWFGAGRSRLAPGTAGSLAALPVGAALVLWTGVSGLLVSTALLLIIGTLAADRVVKVARIDDPGFIVVDEVVGQWLTLAAVPLSPGWYGAAFVLFRLADITKPWPVSWADRTLPGGLGVMLDDVLAGLYAVAGLLIGRWLLGEWGMGHD